MAIQALTAELVSRIFSEDEKIIEELCGELLLSRPYEYSALSRRDRDAAVLLILKGLQRDLAVSGSHRAEDWEKGWGQNLDEFRENARESSLKPGYFSRVENRTVLRLDGDLVVSEYPELIYDICDLHRIWFMARYLSGFDTVFEFGCGTGWNLARFDQLRPGRKLVGLDWAQSAVNLVNELGERHSLDITGRRFDFYNPDYGLDVPEGSAMFTLTALEQVGEDFGPFLDFMLAKGFKRCVHAEPILEFYDPDDLLDNLALQYHAKRNYLGPLLTKLRSLEKEGKIVIEKVHRVRFGNLFNESLSTIVWSPK